MSCLSLCLKAAPNASLGIALIRANETIIYHQMLVIGSHVESYQQGLGKVRPQVLLCVCVSRQLTSFPNVPFPRPMPRTQHATLAHWLADNDVIEFKLVKKADVINERNRMFQSRASLLDITINR